MREGADDRITLIGIPKNVKALSEDRVGLLLHHKMPDLGSSGEGGVAPKRANYRIRKAECFIERDQAERCNHAGDEQRFSIGNPHQAAAQPQNENAREKADERGLAVAPDHEPATQQKHSDSDPLLEFSLHFPFHFPDLKQVPNEHDSEDKEHLAQGVFLGGQTGQHRLACVGVASANLREIFFRHPGEGKQKVGDTDKHNADGLGWVHFGE